MKDCESKEIKIDGKEYEIIFNEGNGYRVRFNNGIGFSHVPKGKTPTFFESEEEAFLAAEYHAKNFLKK